MTDNKEVSTKRTHIEIAQEHADVTRQETDRLMQASHQFDDLEGVPVLEIPAERIKALNLHVEETKKHLKQAHDKRLKIVSPLNKFMRKFKTAIDEIISSLEMRNGSHSSLLARYADAVEHENARKAELIQQEREEGMRHADALYRSSERIANVDLESAEIQRKNADDVRREAELTAAQQSAEIKTPEVKVRKVYVATVTNKAALLRFLVDHWDAMADKVVTINEYQLEQMMKSLGGGSTHISVEGVEIKEITKV